MELIGISDSVSNLVYGITCQFQEFRRLDHAVTDEKFLRGFSDGFLEDLANEDKKNHPWQLVLWNCGKYARMTGNLTVYKQMHRKAMDIACCNRENVTMMTFAISISADRLSWCKMMQARDVQNAEIEFMNTIKQIKHAGTTREMDQHFMIDQHNLSAMLHSNLDYLRKAYLR